METPVSDVDDMSKGQHVKVEEEWAEDQPLGNTAGQLCVRTKNPKINLKLWKNLFH